MLSFTESQDRLIHQTLKQFWGFDDFRSSQKNIILSVINGKDTLALLPTGGGKSLCYQLPAIVLEGTCIVISPLLALMRDQIDSLQGLGIEAELLSSELDEFEEESVYNRCKDGLIKILYISPERLQNQLFLRNIQEINISFIAVDEAHCISEWGSDFRPSYQNIKKFRQEFKNVPCLALTATATNKVVEEISIRLGLHDPQIYKQSFKRDNLNIILENTSNKYNRILEFLRQNPVSGIIYTRTRREAEELTLFLKNNRFQNVDFFHAGLTPNEKEKLQKKWIASQFHVLVSTNAFGMGIDKDNVGFVIHLSPSSTIENYYQEIGRAGRNGNEALVLMLWNEQELTNIDNTFQNQIPNKSEYQKILTYLYSIFQVADSDLPERTFQLDINRIKNLTKLSTAKIKNILTFLNNQELIYYKNNISASTIQSFIQSDELEQLAPSDAYFMELLFRNLPGLAIQKVYFSDLAFCKKNGFDISNFKERLKQMQKSGHLEYLDGSQHSIKFLKPRNDRHLFGEYWILFNNIQKNKLRKWEENKFFIQDPDFCKMKLILSYFGERDVENCGKCSICRKRTNSKRNLSSDIAQQLSNRPMSLNEMAANLNFYSKESISETLIFLLDIGKVRMLNYKTYMLNQ
ncbi:RecQ family ATP-dependent DNA helicase [Epilithonimonas hungarica]|uniref:ATP-dependent DNA helicase RecQ n=1 Tax=Epilithonimonas hungarica TaxID=454006 RepID=A0A1G7NXE8_9FLAO|nr:ATP-dependent DNA helicase RecQ [Epilithonimonas hungarica]SDF77870.1 ATP-dependent DNA helicase RecQ [Epilithonimonas hungarica]